MKIKIDKPIPKNTLTPFDPVTLPIDESAYLSWIAATRDANVSEKFFRKKNS